MRSIHVLKISLIILWVTFAISACKIEVVEKPVLVKEMDDLTVPIDRLAFHASDEEWYASLLSFTQLIDLSVHYTDTGFYISQENDLGIVEGPGQICLRSGENYFYYDVILVNSESSPLHAMDYRSPKTVNPDSSLTHQKLVFEIDRWRNIINREESPGLFEEEEISLPTEAGIYRAQPEKPLSSYYVQPGSCTKIEVNAIFKNDKSGFQVVAGPLNDTYDNLIADGTLVTFIYYDGEYTYQMEAASLGGLAKIEIPIQNSNDYKLFAKIDNTISSTINLKAL